MVVWSSIFRAGFKPATFSSLFKSGAIQQSSKNALQVRLMSEERTLHIAPSRFQWNKFKDQVHLYIMLGVIPITALILYVNIFIGPAQLTPIPEGYTPKHWEYHRHPISRWLARYIYPSPQQDYEKMCHYYYEETEKQQLRVLADKVKELMYERNDYEAYYYLPATAKYVRFSRDNAQHILDTLGDM